MKKRVEVSAGVLVRDDGHFLLGQRADGTFYPGYWEFPGGKVESGETPAGALIRELHEELGIRVRGLRPWLVREHDYEHAHVRLHFFEVYAWDGELIDHVHAALAWQRPDVLEVGPMLPANGPIMKALRLPRVMAITDVARLGVETQLVLVDKALAQGHRLFQIREPDLPTDELKRFSVELVRRVHARGGLVVANSAVSGPLQTCLDGVHYKADALMALRQRPACDWVGASCHQRHELEKAAALGLDYAIVGPVQPTASHPGQATIGWARFAELVRGLPMPVFAIGGMSMQDMEVARGAGAHGIAAIQGVWRG